MAAEFTEDGFDSQVLSADKPRGLLGDLVRTVSTNCAGDR